MTAPIGTTGNPGRSARGGLVRRLRMLARRLVRRTSLTQRFLLVSIAVVACAMLILGAGVSYYVRASITQGIANTVAAGVDALVANSVEGVFDNEALSEADRNRLDMLLEIGSDAETTRLIQLRIMRLDGRVLYEASDGIIDQPQSRQFDLARSGTVSSDVVELPLAPAGPFGAHPIAVVRLYTPLHRPGTGEIFGVAALYYSAKSLLDIQFRTQFAVWTVVLVAGLFLIAALYAFIASANRTIVRQAHHLSANLVESRHLSEQIRTLHSASEQLRVDAIEANEQLLARVGSDIHDGPLQLLTLVTLQLGRALKRSGEGVAAGLQSTLALTSDAIAELRAISTGLVLPELAGLTLAQTLALAIQRHEGATGTTVHSRILDLDRAVEGDIQVCLYRVVQESLNNAFRHSGGAGQSVAAWQRDGHITVETANTRAEAAAEAVPLHGPRLGMRGMRLRVEAVGGEIASMLEGDRVVVRVIVPTASAEQNAA